MNWLFATADPAMWKTGLVLGLLVFAIVLFALEKISVDLVTLLMLSVLIVTGILTPSQAFAGFSDQSIIILGSIFVISGALQETGVLDAIGARLVRIAARSERLLLFGLMGLASSLSAFMNNTSVTAMLVGPVIGVAKKSGISPSKLLMPLAYASILGGTCTLIGTSTNVIVSGYIARVHQLEPLGLFEFTPIGLIIVAVGLTYMMLLGRRLLPDHPEESFVEEFAIREYLSEIMVLPASPLVGQAVFTSDLAKLGFRVVKVIRGKEEFVPVSLSRIREHDVLLVTGKVEDLMKVSATEGIEIKPDFKLSDADLQSPDTKVAEVLVTPQSDLRGRTLKEAAFKQEYGMTVLAIYRQGRSLREKIGSIRLRAGDLLLIQGAKDRLLALRRRRNLAVLEELSPSLFRKRKGLYAASIFIVALIVGGVGWLPVSVALLLAAVGIVLCRCIAPERAYEYIDWRLLILIGGMLAFGTAMETSGAANLLARGVVALLNPYGITAVLAGFFILTIVLTQPMSNAAAALVILPVALNTAQQLGVNQRTFAIAIMLAASVSFVAPLEPSCILVYGPGKYRFVDFLKTGLLLTVLLTILVLLLIPVFWPLHPGTTALLK